MRLAARRVVDDVGDGGGAEAGGADEVGAGAGMGCAEEFEDVEGVGVAQDGGASDRDGISLHRVRFYLMRGSERIRFLPGGGV